MSKLRLTACIDSEELVRENRRVLDIRYEIAKSLGRSALDAIDAGQYLADHVLVDWSAEIRAAEAEKFPFRPMLLCRFLNRDPEVTSMQRLW